MRSSAPTLGIAIALLLAGISPALAQSPPPVAEAPSLQAQVEAILATAPAGTRWGLLVVDAEGREVVAIDPDHRFIPASNTKLFTTAAAMAVMRGSDERSVALEGASVAIAPNGDNPPDIFLSGGGGLSLSTAANCTTRCVSRLAGFVGGTQSIRDIIADDTAFVDQRWSPGMSWNNIGTDSGTATSALIVDNNELPIEVAPGVVGAPGNVSVSAYLTLRNETVTVTEGPTRISVERPVNSRELRVFGSIAAGSPPWRDKLGIDDPADYAGWALQQALRARGVEVTGDVRVRHRPVAPADVTEPPRPAPAISAMLHMPAAPLLEEIATINKPSQNLHAEALLRRLGMDRTAYMDGNAEIFDSPNPAPAPPPTQRGSREAGLAAMNRVLEAAGIPRAGYDFSDGSGMSTYNRVSPRAGVALLRWTQTQWWGAEWRASLPIGGVDGTLRRRFAGTPLQGRIWAKTGTLNATNALSGYLTAASGRELTFSFFANDVPDGGNAVPVMDAALLAVAAAN